MSVNVGRKNTMKTKKLSDVGEKEIISSFVKPLFNPNREIKGVGDDCALVHISGENVVLASTDRVPADLFAYKIGVIDAFELGQYAAKLNLSDIFAGGGVPTSLLLNIACPSDYSYGDFQAILQGVKKIADEFSCDILGGDISESSELNIVVTSIGISSPTNILRRCGAKAGDSIFISGEVGLTPAFFAAHSENQNVTGMVEASLVEKLNCHFKMISPDRLFSKALVESKACTSCMDNTDGVGQCMIELAEASKVSFILEKSKIPIPGIVHKVANVASRDPIEFSFGAGVDFSLVGTLDGYWNQERAQAKIHPKIKIIGYVEKGDGVFIQDEFGGKKTFECKGWNYFHQSTRVVF